MLLGFFLYFSVGGGLGDLEELFVVDLGIFKELEGILVKLFLTDLIPHLKDLPVEQSLATFTHKLLDESIVLRHELGVDVGVLIVHMIKLIKSKV